MMGNGTMDGMMGGFGLVGMLFNLLLLAGLLALVAWAVVRGLPSGRPRDERSSSRTDPEEILRERFARGEIDAEEYGRSLAILRGEPARNAHGDPAQTTGDRETAGR